MTATQFLSTSAERFCFIFLAFLNSFHEMCSNFWNRQKCAEVIIRYNPWGIRTILFRFDAILSISKTRPVRSLGRRVTFWCRFAFRVFHGGSSKMGFPNAISLIFLILAGEVLKKWKKSPSRWGGVDNCENRVPTQGADQKKKWFPCSMGVPKSIFATPLVRERRCRKTWKFDTCEISWFWGGEKMAKMGRPLRFCVFNKFLKVT